MQKLIIPKTLRHAYRQSPSTREMEGGRERPSGGFDNTFRSISFLQAFCLIGVVCLPLLTSACQKSKLKSGVVWAEVDGQPIFRDQVEKIYRNRVSPGGEAADKEEVLSYELNILDELINNQILVAHAEHSGITVSEAEVDTKVSQLESPYSKEEFVQKLKQRGMTESDLREEVRNSLMVDKLINKDIDSRVSVSDAEIAAYYQRNKAAFSIPETEYHLAQIEVTPGPDSDLRNLKNDDAKTPAAARQKIQALYAQLRSGADFAIVAQDYSEDPTTASSGGDMGFIPASGLDANPELKKIVESLKVGQISGIIKTRNAYHIVKLLGIEHAGQGELSDPKVQSSIRKTLINEKEQLLKAAYIETLRDKAKVKNFLAEQIVQHGVSSVK
ncbi:MAG: peptidylprolyl isomerase [Acidobacteria bacterium]|nr:peptidylprolyl isomerase [Acidobacteriota bacterium]